MLYLLTEPNCLTQSSAVWLCSAWYAVYRPYYIAFQYSWHTYFKAKSLVPSLLQRMILWDKYVHLIACTIYPIKYEIVWDRTVQPPNLMPCWNHASPCIVLFTDTMLVLFIDKMLVLQMSCIAGTVVAVTLIPKIAQMSLAVWDKQTYNILDGWYIYTYISVRTSHWYTNVPSPNTASCYTWFP